MKALVVVALLAGCASGPRRFPLRPPLWRDTDLDSRPAPCRKEKDKTVCLPEDYDSSVAWDGADNMAFRPVARFFAVDPAGDAVNVNAFDEVPDSAWFTNRIGVRPMAADELVRGPCGDQAIDVEVPDGAIVIDRGKDIGGNPGFRVKMPDGTKYMFKADVPLEPERASGATAIATRVYHAAGWWAACDTVVYVRPAQLKLTPGLKVTDNFRKTRNFDQKALEQVLADASHRGDRVRFAASRWLPGRPIGPFRYRGTRGDDANDVVRHEDRRDLRGARLIAAWLSHYDSREANSLDTWMADDAKDPESSPGHVVHYYIDLGDCMGGIWEPDEMARRLGRAYFLDFRYLLADFISLGAILRPWDTVHRPRGSLFGWYSREAFDPEGWRGLYPNPAFERMRERDGAWAARIIARFSDEALQALAQVGDFTDPAQTAFLARELAARRDIILRRYFQRASPVTDLTVAGDELCGVDLARRTGVYPGQAYHYVVRVHGVEREARALDDGRVCVPLVHGTGLEGRRDDDPARYLVVELSNGQALGALRAHLYDLGARGFALVGVERDAP